MIFLRYTTEGIVFYKNFDPTNPITGVQNRDGSIKTLEQLQNDSEGVLVNEIPIPQNQHNKQEILKYNNATKQLYYEYIDIPQQQPTTEERLITLENALLKSQGVI